MYKTMKRTLLMIIIATAAIYVTCCVPVLAETRNVSSIPELAAAFLDPAVDTITIEAGTYELPAALSLNRNISIIGNGDVIFTIPEGANYRHLNVSGTVEVALSGLVFRGNGEAVAGGGGIQGTSAGFTMNNCIVEQCFGSGHGGGIYARDVSGDNLTVQYNRVAYSVARAEGGGIYATGTVNLTNSIITGNKSYAVVYCHGGGILATTIILTDCVVSDNYLESNGDSGHGGGITGTNIDISNTRVYNNRVVNNNFATGAGIEGEHVIVRDGSTVSNNTCGKEGAGILSRDDLLVKDSIVSSNQSANGSGGGIFVRGTAVLENVTMMDNSAKNSGGAIYANSTLSIANGYIANNLVQGDGGAVYITAPENLTSVTDSTFWGNYAAYAVDDPDFPAPQVVNTTYTAPFRNLYNNYDVNHSGPRYTNQAPEIYALAAITFPKDTNITWEEFVNSVLIMELPHEYGISDDKDIDKTLYNNLIASGGAASNFDSIVWDQPGDYTVTLIVTDSDGAAADHPVMVTIGQNVFTVTYKGNTGAPETQTKEVIFGEVLPAPDVAPSRSGYNFNGWNTQPDGSGAAYIEGTTLIEHDVMLHALWSYKGGGTRPTASPTAPPTTPPTAPPQPETHARYLFGYPSGEVKIDDNITRAETASLFYHISELYGQGSHTSDFVDTPQDAWYYNSAAFLSYLGIAETMHEQKLLPDNTITRAEFAALLAEIYLLPVPDGNVAFSDVTVDHWAYDAINTAYQSGLMDTQSGSMFAPDAYMQRYEAVQILNKTTGRNISLDDIPPGPPPYSDISHTHKAYPDVFIASDSY